LLRTCTNRNRLIPSPEPFISPKTSPETNLSQKKKILGDTLLKTPRELFSPKKKFHRSKKFDP